MILNRWLALSLTRSLSQATSETYDASSLCGRPANETGFIDPGQLHTAVMEKLIEWLNEK